MQTLVTETKAKETTLQEKLQKKRNLFGLSVTSLIAACSADKAAGGGAGDDGGPVILPFVAVKAEKAPEDNSIFTADTKGTETLTVDVKITESNTVAATLTFSDVKNNDNSPPNVAKIRQLTADTNQYDLVVSTPSINMNSGGIFIFWNVAEITQDEEITAGSVNPPNRRLEIKSEGVNDIIGEFAPKFLQISGAANNYDMVFGGRGIDRSPGADTEEGAIYVLWDVANYSTGGTIIDLGDLADNATSGSLTIKGAAASDFIGIHAPEFLQIRGEADNYDMVIRSHTVDKPGGTTNEGAIYVLWDVANYYSTPPSHHTITLDSSATGATAGSLAIYGVIAEDLIGVHAPEFLKIGGKDNNYDMIIRSDYVDKTGGGTDTGAIYILWDVADYYNAEENKNLSIDLTPASASSGLLTIYGRADRERLGEDGRNILYGSDDDGNKVLTNIDNDVAGTIDIAIADGMYTYIFFGDKIANDGNNDDKVDSKSIDLAKIVALTGGDGYFEYNFGTSLTDISDDLTATAANQTNATGYRFAGVKTFAEVESTFASSLSDVDADLGVWDIA